MQFKSKTETYRAAVVEWLGRNQYRVTEHIIGIIVSVLTTRDDVMIGGSFAKAVCDNDLFGVARCADKEVFENLKTILSAYHNISVAEYLIEVSPAAYNEFKKLPL
jgi:hypothetical protein